MFIEKVPLLGVQALNTSEYLVLSWLSRLYVLNWYLHNW